MRYVCVCVCAADVFVCVRQPRGTEEEGGEMSAMATCRACVLLRLTDFSASSGVRFNGISPFISLLVRSLISATSSAETSPRITT